MGKMDEISTLNKIWWNLPGKHSDSHFPVLVIFIYVGKLTKFILKYCNFSKFWLITIVSFEALCMAYKVCNNLMVVVEVISS